METSKTIKIDMMETSSIGSDFDVDGVTIPQPLNNYVIMEIPKDAYSTKSGIVITNIIESTSSFKVLAVSTDIKTTLKPGDRVMVHGGDMIKVENVSYLLVDYFKIVAIV